MAFHPILTIPFHITFTHAFFLFTPRIPATTIGAPHTNDAGLVPTTTPRIPITTIGAPHTNDGIRGVNRTKERVIVI